MNFNVTKFYVEILYGKRSCYPSKARRIFIYPIRFLAKKEKKRKNERKKERLLLRISVRTEDGSDEFLVRSIRPFNKGDRVGPICSRTVKLDGRKRAEGDRLSTLVTRPSEYHRLR